MKTFIEPIIKSLVAKEVLRCEEIVREQSILTYEERYTIHFYSLELEWKFQKLKIEILLAVIGVKIDADTLG